MDLLELARNLLAIVGMVTVLWVLLSAAWMGLGDSMDEHWPVGLDCDPTLDVQNGIGDSRPIRGVWTALDPVSPEQVEEDRPYLSRGPSPYADNMVLPSGRSWRFDRVIEEWSVPEDRTTDRLSRMAAGYFG